jgi:2',3'-cyclic-nucleotide 2'-phosphodiesterase (5'-nucleotidase family)
VIALSHSGIDHNGQGEDAALAAKVPGIDVIISGHTHETLERQPEGRRHDHRHRRRVHAYLGQLALTVTPSGHRGAPPQ